LKLEPSKKKKVIFPLLFLAWSLKSFSTFFMWVWAAFFFVTVDLLLIHILNGLPT
jgi:hypothetical protein